TLPSTRVAAPSSARRRTPSNASRSRRSTCWPWAASWSSSRTLPSMIDDLRSLEDGAVLRADLCIVGAGAAGIAMARELIGSGLDVLLLESGGLEEEPESQALNRGENVGLHRIALDECRFRVFGGTTARWGGWSGELDTLDFAERDWVPLSGWPFGRGELV